MQTRIQGFEQEISVAEFLTAINLQLQQLGEFKIFGEINQMNVSSRGGVNIVLKDPEAQAVVNLSGYAPRIEGIDYIEEGMLIYAYGTGQIWEPSGRFSLNIRKVTPKGEGALKIAYEKLLAKLKAEGLFDERFKQSLPDLVTKVALLTAKNSAAYSDFVKILQENPAGINIDFYPVMVQGKYAESELIKTLTHVSKLNYDCIVITRGGGSLEDLIAFNSERLARKVFASKVPILAAIGHERDISIIEMIADIHASTPSQAAYYLINNNINFLTSLKEGVLLSENRLKEEINTYKQRIRNSLYMGRSRLQNLLGDYQRTLQKQVLQLQQHPKEIERMLNRIILNRRILEANNPDNILKKGFAKVIKAGNIITSSGQLAKHDKITLTFSDGEAESKILSVNTDL